ncbi:hypothetical protein GGR58DRAFT_477117 [Xylaria digitata]|nr:hypothetical protein GGR58DRAFT_477117 [Xylaria digitata]
MMYDAVQVSLDIRTTWNLSRIWVLAAVALVLPTYSLTSSFCCLLSYRFRGPILALLNSRYRRFALPNPFLLIGCKRRVSGRPIDECSTGKNTGCELIFLFRVFRLSQSVGGLSIHLQKLSI